MARASAARNSGQRQRVQMPRGIAPIPIPGASGIPGIPGTCDTAGTPAPDAASQPDAASAAGARGTASAPRSPRTGGGKGSKLAEVARGSTLNLAGAVASAAATFGVTVLVTRLFSQPVAGADRKSTRLNSSHGSIS